MIYYVDLAFKVANKNINSSKAHIETPGGEVKTTFQSSLMRGFRHSQSEGGCGMVADNYANQGTGLFTYAKDNT